MTTEFKLDGENINIYQMEHYVKHMLSELYSKRNDGWVEEHYRKELNACGKVIAQYIEKLNVVSDEMVDWVKSYEKEKLIVLLENISKVN